MELLSGVSHLKHATIRIQAERVIYFDPFRIEGAPEDADIIFVTHSHFDHFSPDDIRKVANKKTVLVLPEDCLQAAADAGFADAVAVRPLESYEVDGLKFNTVPAYNIGKEFHKKDRNWVGYIVYVNGASYYFAGDSDMIPEMKDVKADVVFLPVGGTYTMTWKEAVQAADMMNPQVAVPVHYSEIVGTVDDAENFINGLNASIKGIIL